MSDELSKEEKSVLRKVAKEEKPEYVASFPGLVDLIWDEQEEKIKFLTFTGDKLSSVDIDGKTRFPPPIEGILWKLPNLSNVIKEYKKHTSSDTSSTSDSNSTPGYNFSCSYCEEYLYPEIVDYFTKFSDPPSPRHYDFLALMAFHSHLIEKFNFSPILFLVAAKDRGKTPTLKALAAICRRGIFTETFREANLIRWGGDYDASLFFDVKNFPKKVEMAQCEDIIYGRAEKGARASRVLFPEKGSFKDMKNFNIFGVTGATSNHMVDEITEARCVVYRMPYSDTVFNILPTPEYGLPLQEKLVAFRMAHFNTPFITIDKVKPGKIENYLIGFHRMVKTFFPSHEKEFLEFKGSLMKEKAEEAESSYEGKLLLAVLACEPLVLIGTSFLSVQFITDEINRERTERFKLNNDSIGKSLKSMGFTLKRSPDGTKRGIFYDRDFILKLQKQYGINTPGGVLASDVSEGQMNDQQEEVL